MVVTMAPPCGKTHAMTPNASSIFFPPSNLYQQTNRSMNPQQSWSGILAMVLPPSYKFPEHPTQSIFLLGQSSSLFNFGSLFFILLS